MALSAPDVTALLNDGLLKDARSQWGKLDTWDKRRRGGLVKTWMPNGVDDEYRDTMRKARGPWLQFAAQIYAQSINVEAGADLDTWTRGWVASGMDARQPGLNLDVCENGYSYLLTFPAADGSVFMRHLRASKTWHTYEDPWDDSPEYVITQVRDPGRSGDKSRGLIRVFDDEAMYEIHGDPARPTEVTTTPHTLGASPVSIINAGFTDTNGDPISPVVIGREAYIRLVDAGFTLLMVGRYGAFPQKWQTGGTLALDEAGNALIRPSVDSLLHNQDYETKFGAFPSADIDKVVAAVDEQFEELTAILQIPPHYMLGKVVNLSSDALAASEAGFQRKIDSIRRAMSLGYAHALGNAATILGNKTEGYGMPTWQDVATRSLASGADAALKLISTGADPELAYQLVPTWSRADAHQAAEYARTHQAPTATTAADAAPVGDGAPEGADETTAPAGPTTSTTRQATPPPAGDDPARLKNQFDALGIAVRTGVEPDWAANRVGLPGAKFTGAVPVSLRPADQD